MIEVGVLVTYPVGGERVNADRWDGIDMRDAIYLTRKIASLKERFAKARQKEGTVSCSCPTHLT